MASLVKYHALGNDYLVLDVRERAEMYAVEEIKRVCHRNYGVGSDGILYGPLPSSKALCRLEIWNPDGSQAEKSGNGLRIFARYLYDQGTVSEGVPFTIETLGGTVSCVVNAPDDISIQMGHVSFSSTDIPVSGPPRDVLLEEMRIGDSTIVLSAATIGNPHAVHLTECLTKTLACQWGPLIEKATAVFPKRTNVQFVQVMDRNTIRIEKRPMSEERKIEPSANLEMVASFKPPALKQVTAWDTQNAPRQESIHLNISSLQVNRPTKVTVPDIVTAKFAVNSISITPPGQ